MDNINLNEKWILKITTDCTKYPENVHGKGILMYGYISLSKNINEMRTNFKGKKRNSEEAHMQSEFFKLISVFFPHLPDKLAFAVPNGGSRKNAIEGANFKRQGVKAGVSDIIVLIPKKGFASLCIEFKTRVGKQSEEQKEFQKQAESCRNKYVVVRSASQAIEELRKYLS